MSYEGSTRQISVRPIEKAEAQGFINRELVPLLVQWRAAFNAFIAAINGGAITLGDVAVLSGTGVPVAAPAATRAIYVDIAGGAGSTLYVWEGAAWAPK